MLFSLKRIFHNIRRRIGIYLIFILEFAVGVTMMSSALNVVFSMQRNLEAAREQMADAIEIVWHDSNWSPGIDFSTAIKPWEEDIAVSYDTYLRAKQIYGNDLEFRYTLEADLWQAIFCESREKPMIDSVNVYVYYVNNAKFKELFGTDMESGKVYAGEIALENINKLLAYSEDSKYLIGREDDYPQPFIVKDGKLAYCDGRDFEIAPQPTTDRKHFINEEDVNPDFPPGTLSQMVFVPIEEFRVYRDTVRRNFNPYNNYWEEIEVLEDTTDEDGIGTTTVRKKPHYSQPGVRSVLSVELKSDDADVNIIPSLISFLNNSTIDKEFSMNEEVLRLQAVIDDFHQVLIMQIIRASAVLLIVVLGTTGLFLIFLYRRKKQMAVSIAYGSTKARLFGEIFSEVMLITAVGTALGIFALKYYTMPGALEMYNAATFRPECVIIPVIAAVLCAFLTALLSFAGIGEVSPAKILKDL